MKTRRKCTALTRFQKMLLYLHLASVRMLMGILGWFLKYIMKLEKGLKKKVQRKKSQENMP